MKSITALANLGASLALFALPVLLVAAPAGAQNTASAADEVEYTFQIHDTLFTLARVYFTGPNAAAKVAALNHIANVRQIPPGKVLRIPRALLKDEQSSAKIETFSGPVTVRSAAQSIPAKAGDVLGEGASIETGRNAFVALRLADGSVLALPSQSNLTISWLRKVVLNGALERDIKLNAGRLRTKVTPMTDPHSRFRVVTPIAVSAVRGTEFRVAYEPQGAFSATEVADGKVKFADGSSSSGLDLPLGFGAANAGGKPTGIVKLLDPPKLDNPDKVQSDAELNFAIVPVPQASRYHVQIGKDAGFIEVIDEAVGAAPAFTLPSQPADTYFVRVSAYDNVGLEGNPATYTFERRRNLVKGGMDPAPPGVRRLRFRWDGTADGKPQYRFQLLQGGENGAPVVDETGLTENVLSVSNLPAGDYAWRVCSLMIVKGKVIATWTAPQSIHVSK